MCTIYVKMYIGHMYIYIYEYIYNLRIYIIHTHTHVCSHIQNKMYVIRMNVYCTRTCQLQPHVRNKGNPSTISLSTNLTKDSQMDMYKCINIYIIYEYI